MIKKVLTAAVIVVASCGAHAEVASPQPPGGYVVPGNAVAVSTSAQLTAELGKSAHIIVLRDGVYSATTPFTVSKAHQIYAEHVGGAVLTAGLKISIAGVTIQGLSFNVTNKSAAVFPWGNSADDSSVIELQASSTKNTKLLDLTINGNSVVGTAIAARQPEGLQIQRVVASGFLSYGLYADADRFNLAVANAPALSDLNLSNVSRATPKISDGTAEACLWVGYAAKVDRVKVRNCAWMGVWTGTSAKNVTMSDIDIDAIRYGVGIYAEHFTTNSLFQRIDVGPGTILGVECEWADPAWQRKPACDGVVFQDATFRSSCAGVWLDEGTKTSTVRRSTFVGQSVAGVVTTRTKGSMYDASGNDYSQLMPGAKTVAELDNPCPLNPTP